MLFYEVSKSFVSEFHGCMWLSLSLSWIEMNFNYKTSTLFTLALVHCFAVMVWTWACIHLSSSHFNPLITSVLLFSKRISFFKALIYYIAQFLGFLVGVGMTRFLMPIADKQTSESQVLCYGCAQVDNGFEMLSVTIAEFLGGFLVVFAYYASIIDKRATKDMYGIFMGGAYAIANLMYGARMTVFLNPFRYLAGAIANNIFDYYYVYMTVPFFGGFYASWLFDKRILVDQPKISEHTFEVK